MTNAEKIKACLLNIGVIIVATILLSVKYDPMTGISVGLFVWALLPITR